MCDILQLSLLFGFSQVIDYNSLIDNDYILLLVKFLVFFPTAWKKVSLSRCGILLGTVGVQDMDWKEANLLGINFFSLKKDQT